MPRVSAALAVNNGAETLGLALRSTAAQTFRDFELIVVDDGSTDGSGEIAAGFGARVIKQTNQGLGAARKRLVEEASGELIAFIDADDEWVPDKLETQVAAMDESGAALVHSDCWYVYEDGREVERNLDMFARRVGTNHPAATGLLPTPIPAHTASRRGGAKAKDREDAFDHIVPSNLIVASSALFDRRKMLEVGNFTGDTVRCSDWYGWFLLASRYEFLHLSIKQVKYKVRSESLANIGYRFHEAQRYLLEEKILPRFDEIFARVPEPRKLGYRKKLLRSLGIAYSSMAKHLRTEGRLREARDLDKRAMRLASGVVRVWTRAFKGYLPRLRG